MTRIIRQGLSERQYARHIGRSRGSVQKLRAAGRLIEVCASIRWPSSKNTPRRSIPMPEVRTGMSERKYARHARISRGAIRNARAAGRLVFHADGSIDAAASDALRLRTADPARERALQAPALAPASALADEPATAMKPVPEAAVGAVSETLKEQGLQAPAAAGGMTYLQARTANEVLKAQERRLRLQKLKGEVVDRARAVALVFRLARQERDAWLGWPARIAATMAAELGVGTHELQAALNEHVRDHLRELAEIAPDFR